MFTDVLNNLNVLFQIHLIKCGHFVWVVVFKLGNESFLAFLARQVITEVCIVNIGTYLRGK